MAKNNIFNRTKNKKQKNNVLIFSNNNFSKCFINKKKYLEILVYKKIIVLIQRIVI
jgi:hypothetical protein